jgi:hypothetical protein
MTWTTDVNEVRDFGARANGKRTPEQTDIGRFWFMNGPQAWNPIVRQLAEQKKLDVTDSARLFALVSLATSDSFIAVFDAKYTYNFWRPITAIRNGDLDGNPATERDASWVAFIDTPMHPEYPCAHCIIAATLGAVLKAEIGDGPKPKLSSSSPTAPGAVRSWSQVDDLVEEVAHARIYDGVHYRNSTEVGMAMGKKIGEFVAGKYLVTKPSAEASK